jgi:hypothetical protein
MPGLKFRRVLAAQGTMLVAVILLASGCAKEEMPKTYVVKGKVVRKDGKPFTGGGQLTLTSVDDPELRGYGKMDKDGTFTLSTIGHSSTGRSQVLGGAVDGMFRVSIRPDRLGGNSSGPPMFPGRQEFLLKKHYKVEPHDNNDLTIVFDGIVP